MGRRHVPEGRGDVLGAREHRGHLGERRRRKPRGGRERRCASRGGSLVHQRGTRASDVPEQIAKLFVALGELLEHLAAIGVGLAAQIRHFVQDHLDDGVGRASAFENDRSGGRSRRRRGEAARRQGILFFLAEATRRRIGVTARAVFVETAVVVSLVSGVPAVPAFAGVALRRIRRSEVARGRRRSRLRSRQGGALGHGGARAEVGEGLGPFPAIDSRHDPRRGIELEDALGGDGAFALELPLVFGRLSEPVVAADEVRQGAVVGGDVHGDGAAVVGGGEDAADGDFQIAGGAGGDDGFVVLDRIVDGVEGHPGDAFAGSDHPAALLQLRVGAEGSGVHRAEPVGFRDVDAAFVVELGRRAGSLGLGAAGGHQVASQSVARAVAMRPCHRVFRPH